VQVPTEFDPVQGLRMMGYNTSKPTAAINSYKIHFVPQDTSKTLNGQDRKIIYDLMRKYQ
jgi:N-acetylmuramoyl-L-alanine amidase